jgi:hypothetical protein
MLALVEDLGRAHCHPNVIKERKATGIFLCREACRSGSKVIRSGTAAKLVTGFRSSES